MTIDITIPIFSTFWGLPPDIRVFLAFLVMGLIILGLSFLWSPGINPYTLMALFFLFIAIAFLFRYVNGIIMAQPYAHYPMPNWTSPINITVT